MALLEIAPGIRHWLAVHPEIGIEVSSYYVVQARTVLDPLFPKRGLDALCGVPAPEHVLLTNRLHTRHTVQFVQTFGCEVHTNRAGLHHFGASGEIRDVTPRGFEPGDTLPGGIESWAVGGLCPDETAFFVPGPEPALAIADGVVRDGDGPLSFVPDHLMGDDPEAVKRSLKVAYQRILDEGVPFEHLLLAHGAPWIGGAREALHDFVSGS